MPKKKKIIISVSAIVLTIVTCLGITYALWVQRYEQTEKNVISSGCFNTTFSEGDAISLTNVFPITDEEAKLKPSYDVTMNNTCTINAKYQVRIEVLNTSTVDLSYIKASIDNKNIDILNNYDEVDPKIGAATKAYVIYESVLNAGETKTHSIREWLGEHTAINSVPNNARLDTRITIEMTATNSKNLYGAILNQYGGSGNIGEASAGTLASVSQPTDNLMYKMEDDYGVSYYYRGAKDLLNNNLLFAGFQWKIVRINGDGSIRIIYNGTEEHFNTNRTVNSTGADTQVISSAFNPATVQNRFLGYMYGNSGSTRLSSVTNTNNSTIKTAVDAWYGGNIETQEASVKNKISDTLFCNDRQLESGSGAQNVASDYAPFVRLETDDAPLLTCGDKNDRFTVSDTILGNGALTHPVGLITADEVTLAGVAGGMYNTSYYLHTNQSYWTMSASRFFNSNAVVWYVTTSGNRSGAYVSGICGVRPVINLFPDVQVTGSGSATDPFRVID